MCSSGIVYVTFLLLFCPCLAQLADAFMTDVGDVVVLVQFLLLVSVMDLVLDSDLDSALKVTGFGPGVD